MGVVAIREFILYNIVCFCRSLDLSLIKLQKSLRVPAAS